MTITIDRALRDPNLLGAALGNIDPWRQWIAVLKGAFGLELNRTERRAFEKVAGSRAPPSKRVAELWAIVGRRGGKSRMAAAVATYIAAFIDNSAKLSRGEIGYVLVIAPSISQANVVFSYVKGFFEASPILSQLVDSITATEIKLTNGITVGVHPSSFRSVRGRTLVACIVDEVAFLRDETSAIPDVELFRAIVPSLASTHGMFIGISTGYRRAGLLFAKHRDHFGQDNDNILVVAGGTQQFNPILDLSIIARAQEADPEASRSEWHGEFRTDIASLFDDVMIDAAVDRDRPLELPPSKRHSYVGFIDSSGGRHDAYTLCIGHMEGDKESKRFVADVVRGRKPPFNAQEVTYDYAALAKQYGVSTLIGDAYSGEWLAQAVADAGGSYETSKLNKSALYLESLQMFARGAVSLPDMPILIRELRLLERRVHRSGKDAVDHPGNGTDDFANAVVGALRAADVDVSLANYISMDWVDGPDKPTSTRNPWHSVPGLGLH